MADSENIYRFNKIASEAFALLYASFPVVRDLSTTDFDVPLNEFGGVADNSDWELITGSIEWLAEEGFLRFQTSSSDGKYYHVVLTGKGLAVLRLVPDALENPAPLGEQMKSAVKNGTAAVAMKLVDKVFDAGIRYTMAHAGIPI